jgi:hypothetical protein
VNAVVDNATVIVAEDLSRTFTGGRKRGADTNSALLGVGGSVPAIDMIHCGV